MEQTDSLSKNEILAELVAMGFQLSVALQAVESVGQSLSDAVDFILSGHPATSHTGENNISNKNALLDICSREESGSSQHVGSSNDVHVLKQALITDKFKPTREHDKSGTFGFCDNSFVYSKEPCALPLEETELNWEQKAEFILQKYFGYTALKSFQRQALEAWATHQDSLVLAATGAGKSLCFQLPALMTGKVVVAVSPLISLMHDQCLKLARHGVSACFLGSGQVDKSVEDRAMAGMYNVVYVCPETLMRIVRPLQRLAENHGIALFAIDEVHCVSKWGHDFRPDYRRLSLLREKFKASNFKSAKHDIPIMALTATATPRVREDILCSLGIKETATIVVTSFFRPNLRFSVHHSKTSCSSSYEADFQDLILSYGKSVTLSKCSYKTGAHMKKAQCPVAKKQKLEKKDTSDSDETSSCEPESYVEDADSHNLDVHFASAYEDVQDACDGQQMTVEYLEDENDEQMAEDFDVTCGEFKGIVMEQDKNLRSESRPFKIADQPPMEEDNHSLGIGPTIIYTPTRKETEKLAKFLSKSGVIAAAYHAKLPKKHLRQVHELFHDDSLQVVVGTIAFGMGIDKTNVRRIIHYGWPQSLEAYYQEAGRAGRDGLLANCSLYVNMTKLPSLLPSKRDAEQTQHAVATLSECFRYAVSTSCCRAKTLVQYFGENLIVKKCGLCDICVKGPPKCENLSKEAEILLRVLVDLQRKFKHGTSDLDNKIIKHHDSRRCSEMVSFREVIERVKEQYEEGRAKSILWWRGFVRMLVDIGYIRGAANDAATQHCRRPLTIRYLEPMDLGLDFLQACNGVGDHSVCLFPEGDMLQAMEMEESTFGSREWGRGWADPEIRQQRLKGRKRRGKKRKRSTQTRKPNLSTVRGRISAKLSKKNH